MRGSMVFQGSMFVMMIMLWTLYGAVNNDAFPILPGKYIVGIFMGLWIIAMSELIVRYIVKANKEE